MLEAALESALAGLLAGRGLRSLREEAPAAGLALPAATKGLAPGLALCCQVPTGEVVVVPALSHEGRRGRPGRYLRR